MALSKLTYNSFNVTPSASKAVGFGSGADDLSASLSGGSLVFIKKLTADDSGTTLSFVDGSSDVTLDTTYKEYIFYFVNIQPATDAATFGFNGSIDTGSNYNVAKTSTGFRAFHGEGDATSLAYDATYDEAQGTGVNALTYNIGNDADSSASGCLHLFDPGSTTFVKHWNARVQFHHSADYSIDGYIGGYFNTTSAVDAIQFSMDSGNIKAGDICLYGLT